MRHLDFLVAGIRTVGPTLAVVLLTGIAIALLQRLEARRKPFSHQPAFLHNLLLLFVAAAGVISVILTLPVREATRSDLLSLLGIVVSAAVALGSTTFVSNAMAGIMLRIVRIWLCTLL